MRNTTLIALTLVLAACGSGEPAPPSASPDIATSKVYVAVEEGNAIAVLDGRDLRVIKEIPIPSYMPHNVQVAPDGKSVWATLVAEDGDAHGGDHGAGASRQDQLVVIDPATDAIVGRVDLGEGTHPAHVVVTPDSRTVLVTGAEKNEVIRVDAMSRQIIERIALQHGSGVHGARVSPDGAALWAAEIDGKCAAHLDLATSKLEHVELDGQAVQIGISRDGRWIFASQYDTKKIARIDPISHAVSYLALPTGSQGPVQLYPSPDGRTMLVADQGVLAGRPPSNKMFLVDVESMTLTGTVDVGSGAHGVIAVGDRAYVTAIGDDTVTAVDLTTSKIVGQVKTGKKPNGISVWTPSGGTP